MGKPGIRRTSAIGDARHLPPESHGVVVARNQRTVGRGAGGECVMVAQCFGRARRRKELLGRVAGDGRRGRKRSPSAAGSSAAVVSRVAPEIQFVSRPVACAEDVPLLSPPPRDATPRGPACVPRDMGKPSHLVSQVRMRDQAQHPDDFANRAPELAVLTSGALAQGNACRRRSRQLTPAVPPGRRCRRGDPVRARPTLE